VRKATKPPKPRKDFPLFPHASGIWAKSIRGKMHYFGGWDDPHSAESEYLMVADDLHAGRIPRSDIGLSVRDVCNSFMNSKRSRREAGTLSPRTFIQYYGTCDMLIQQFAASRAVSDLRPTDFDKLCCSGSTPLRLYSTGGHGSGG
jgi:hypothetical protein